ncbi:1,4-alpha-glucan branching protein [Streptomyces sp. NPDC001404]|uniref:maltokinase N-terminal cap-like domain-containing protein n=1 Tax=Streptomyces sp. NPDC001404 TaxID=3364571 RepID=UPI0036C57BFA
MAVVHRTTLTPTKDELLASWLPTRPWYRPGAGAPQLERAGGFRLDDPKGEVGIEFMAVTDTAGAEPVTYLVPLSYRGAPLDGAEDALVGTMDHGVLGKRWAYDGCHDPVLVAELLALIEGRTQPQAQSASNTPDHEVAFAYTGEAPVPTDFASVAEVQESQDATELASAAHGMTLRLNRVLRPGPEALPQGATGHVTSWWRLPDGTTRARGLFAVLRTVLSTS